MDLLNAVRSNDIKEVERLLNNGADIEAVDKYGWTSLMSASEKGHTEIVKMLLDKGADVKAADECNWTSLVFASRNGHTGIVELLLDKGADVNAVDEDGWTSLMFASDNGHTEIVKMLLDKGADIEVVDVDGWSSLMYASNNGHTKIVKLLESRNTTHKGSNNMIDYSIFNSQFFEGKDIQWFDKTGIHTMNENKVAEITLSISSTKDHYEGFNIVIQSKETGKIASKFFKFDNYFTQECRVDERTSGEYKGSFEVVGYHLENPASLADFWYICIPSETAVKTMADRMFDYIFIYK